MNIFFKILGLLWDTNWDILSFAIQSFPDDWKFNLSKRVELKGMLKISDPVGFITPFSIRMKSLLRETKKRCLEWDENFPNDSKIEWENWCSEFEYLHKVPCKYFSQRLEISDPIEILTFSDANPKIYEAVAYFRCIINENEIMTSLI